METYKPDAGKELNLSYRLPACFVNYRLTFQAVDYSQ